uniref:F-box domain-containing protein n=1 Tax=Plectus sambesii TaxID=2011161 RepID=A0A914ULE3_9BILA
MPNLRPKRAGGKSHADVTSRDKIEEDGTLLQNGPQIIKRILRVLSAREIHRVSGVCRTWQKYAALVLKERRRVLTIITSKQNRRRTEREVIVDNPETKRFLRDLDMDCGLAIMFREFERRSLDTSPDTSSGAEVEDRMDFEAMDSHLSPSSTVIGALCSTRIFGTSADWSGREQQFPYQGLSALLVPKSLPEGTQISHFSLSLTQAKKMVKSELNRATFAWAYQWPKDQVTKCIIVMAAKFVETQMHQELLSAIRSLQDGDVALAGGVTNEVYSSEFSIDETELYRASEYDDDYDEESEEYFSIMHPAYVGIAFGGENVRAASLVIGEDDRTKESVGKRLTELKAKVEAWGECRQKFGFMFASCSRGRPLIDADNAAAVVFKELMPDIPLTGFFSNGEFGWDFPLPLAQSTKKPKLSDNFVVDCAVTIAIVGFV